MRRKFFCLLLFAVVGSSAIAQERIKEVEPYSFSVGINGDAFSEERVTYVVRRNIDLKDKVVKLGKNAVIKIVGGSLNNGTLLMKSGSSLVGEKNKQASAENLKIHVGGNDVTVSDFNWSNKGVALLSYSDCDDLTVNRCNITSYNSNSIKLVADHVNGVIENVKILNSTLSFKRMGIELQNHGNNQCRFDGVEIKYCHFKMLEPPQYGYAISFSGYGRNALVSKCNISRAVTGVEMAGFSNVKIYENVFRGISSKAVVASNNREMHDIEIVRNDFNHPSAKIQLANANHVLMADNKMKLSYIEVIGCSNCSVVRNCMETSGHYALILDGGKKDTKNNQIKDNIVNQGRNNWAVFRCYGENSSANQFIGNRVTRSGKKGVLFDQKKGASGNTMIQKK